MSLDWTALRDMVLTVPQAQASRGQSRLRLKLKVSYQYYDPEPDGRLQECKDLVSQIFQDKGLVAQVDIIQKRQ